MQDKGGQNPEFNWSKVYWLVIICTAAIIFVLWLFSELLTP